MDPASLPSAGAVSPASADPMDLLVAQVPSNVVAAAGGKNLVPVLVFAVLFGLALRSTSTPATERVVELVQGIFDVSARAVGMVLWLAPVGVAALTFQMAAKGGLLALIPLGRFVGVVVGGLALQMFVVYPLVLWAIGRRDPVAFFRGARPAMAMAFSTASSAATLPTSILVAETRLGVPSDTARFVLTVGATGNQNGTALFEGVAVLFLAQLYGVDLTVPQQLGVIGVAVLGGIGTAGVPGGALPVITALIVSLGLPDTAIGVIVGVDRLLDMCRTTLNVTGDLVIAACVTPPVPRPA
jgi:DAACS family dicarboxylate/amino acid:cation (Na+ or H+) symporter